MGVVDGPIYSVVVGMAILTTLLVPPALPAMVRWAESSAPQVTDRRPVASERIDP
jgi:hypothetical protein